MNQTHSTADGLDPCVGYDDLGDIGPGTKVTVRGATGTIIGTGSLIGCRRSAEQTTTLPARPAEGIPEQVTTTWLPQFDFRIDGIPDSPSYTIEVSNRGGHTFSREQLAAGGWQVRMSIG